MKHISLKVPEVIRRNFRFSTLDFLFIILYVNVFQFNRRRHLYYHDVGFHGTGSHSHPLQASCDTGVYFDLDGACVLLGGPLACADFIYDKFCHVTDHFVCVHL